MVGGDVVGGGHTFTFDVDHGDHREGVGVVEGVFFLVGGFVPGATVRLGSTAIDADTWSWWPCQRSLRSVRAGTPG